MAQHVEPMSRITYGNSFHISQHIMFPQCNYMQVQKYICRTTFNYEYRVMDIPLHLKPHRQVSSYCETIFLARSSDPHRHTTQAAALLPRCALPRSGAGPGCGSGILQVRSKSAASPVRELSFVTHRTEGGRAASKRNYLPMRQERQG